MSEVRFLAGLLFFLISLPLQAIDLFIDSEKELVKITKEKNFDSDGLCINYTQEELMIVPPDSVPDNYKAGNFKEGTGSGLETRPNNFTQPDKDNIDFKLSKDQFLDKYGIDDTSRALIRYYFSKRADGVAMISLFIPVLFGEVQIIRAASTQLTTARNILVTGGAVVYTALVFIPVTVVMGIGIHRIHDFSRKELYLKLMSYQNGRGVDLKPNQHKQLIKKRYYWK